MRTFAYGVWTMVCCLLASGCNRDAAVERPLRVGSKKFTESVILGELLELSLEEAGFSTTHRRQLGGTRVLWNALLRGDIDAYVDYTGTLREEIFADRELGQDGLDEALAEVGLRCSATLGFNNTYALGMLEPLAERLGLRRISQLVDHPDLVLGFTNEFLDRPDGWPGLREAYGLEQRPRGLDHDLAYQGLAAGSLQVIDLYSTDAEIAYYGLRVLQDDRQHFPTYQPLVLYRADLPLAAANALSRLEGRIDGATMVRLNAAVKIERQAEAAVAADFLLHAFDLRVTAVVDSLWTRLRHRTAEHLWLVLLSLGAAILVAIPLGIAAARRPRLGQLLLAAVGVLQTIPSLALLVLMIPLLGIGAPPALAALFLYSLLPIVRNTYIGLRSIPGELMQSAAALGLPAAACLRRVELPLAAPAILAGVKTSAVINIGTATLGALIGAGGYGQPILTGIRLDDLGLILEGALPAAGLALLAQGLFELAERRLVSAGLRQAIR